MAEAQRGHVHHILREVQVFPGKGTAHIVVLGPASGHQLLELGNNHLIAALAVHRGTHVVIDLLAAIQGEHHIGHLPVNVLNVLVIEQHAVGCNCKAELLVIFFFQRPGIFHGSLHRVHGHQRLTAEEVHFNIAPLAGLGNHPVNGSLGGLHIHSHAAAGAKIAGGGEAIAAAQVAVMGDVEAECLDHSLAGQLHSLLHVHIIVISKEQALLLKLPQLLPGLLQLAPVILAQLLRQLLRQLLPQRALRRGQQIIAQLVQHVHRAAVHIGRQILAQRRKGMYHLPFPFLSSSSHPSRRGKVCRHEKGQAHAHPHSHAEVFAYLFSHFWLATVQEVLQADWQEVWHSPQPPLAALAFRVAPLRV